MRISHRTRSSLPPRRVRCRERPLGPRRGSDGIDADRAQPAELAQSARRRSGRGARPTLRQCV